MDTRSLLRALIALIVLVLGGMASASVAGAAGMAGVAPAHGLFSKPPGSAADGKSAPPSAPDSPSATTFADIGAGLPGVYQSAAAWGDYDNDGDLDILLAGQDSSVNIISVVYRNNGNSTFSDIAAGLPGVQTGAAAWGDYDNDGDLDILLSGCVDFICTSNISVVYRNNGNSTFSDIAAGLPGVSYSAAAWGDYDNDGDLDILLAGFTGAGVISVVYRNNGNSTFSDISAGLPGVQTGAAAWGDYDNDGDLDILLSGIGDSGFISRVYRNNGSSTFSDIAAGLPGVSYSAAAWGDYDNDGDLDILLSGCVDLVCTSFISRVYRNNGNSTFSDIAAGLPGVAYSAAAWGDYDNDGDLDILLSGFTGAGYISVVYRNNGNSTFSDISAGLPGTDLGEAAWGDYDNDGDLDILLAGNETTGPIARVYRLAGVAANTAPAAPAGLSASSVAGKATLAWNAASDSQTTSSTGLSYNLRVGTTPGGQNVLAPMSRIDATSSITAPNGWRRIAARGPIQPLSYTLTLTAGLTYYWSVQAVDTAFAGSPFAAEGSFRVPSFTDIAAGLPGVANGTAAWGDYDNDGDLDILLAGMDNSIQGISRVYRNNGNGTFTDIGAGLPGVWFGAAAWGDYDNDGDLDILLTGLDSSNGAYITRVYRNDGGSFANSNAALPGVEEGAAAWGDYDDDGDLDILLAGYDGAGRISVVYRNNGNSTFTDIAAGLTGVTAGEAAWGDYDNDGDLDILLTGHPGSSFISRVYRNNGGSFADINASLTGVDVGAAAWGDYDNDGDLDILLAGCTISSCTDSISVVYRNNGNSTFTDIAAGLTAVREGAAAWGDYDNDGDLDILLAGNTGAGRISVVYRNNGNSTFSDISAALPGVSSGEAAWGDYDNDGDLDILLAGDTGAGLISRVYRLDGVAANTAPAAPAGLSASSVAGKATLAWNAASDSQTTSSTGLSYNLRVGTTPGGQDVLAPMSRIDATASITAPNGWRRIEARGPIQPLSYTLTLTPGLTYYWSVQAVDTAFAGSPFAAEQSFFVGFSDIGAGLPGVQNSVAAWGDYDNDGDLDILLSGGSSSILISRVYRNNGNGTFTDILAGLPGVFFGAAAWGDYDDDGDLDILLAGSGDSGFISRVYRNNGNSTFSDISAGLPGVWSSAVAWGDYDNDGDLDILLSGNTGPDRISRVYRNNGNSSFSDIAAGLTGVQAGAVAWGDYDNDGDLDILLAGFDGSSFIAVVYRNNGNSTFSDISAGLPGVRDSAAAWGDYDNDGDLDILLAGNTGPDRISRVYRNNGNSTFSDISAGLTGVQRGAVAWGDYDNDGDLDILLSGDTSAGLISVVYRNNGNGTFTDISAGLPGVYVSAVAWGDYDNDGDLDILLSGDTGGNAEISRVYRLDGVAVNTAPTAPTGLSASSVAGKATLAWNAASDSQTTSSTGLSYNLRVGTTPGGQNVLAPMSRIDATASITTPNGWRRIAARGPIQPLSYTLTLTAGLTYYWSVQAVDTAFAGSPFAAEGSFRVPSFTDIAAGLPGVAGSAAAWGDYDNDGDLDILLSGLDNSLQLISRVYRNNGNGTFTDIGAGLPGVIYGAAAWGDYDNDGDLDILLSGLDLFNGAFITRVYRNNGNSTFADISAGLPGVESSAAAWGDYDNDGDLDILLSGHDSSNNIISRVYRNNGDSTFSDISAGLTGIVGGTAEWGDYDNDGDLDILLSGQVSYTTRISRVYRNNGNSTFSDISAGLSGVSFSAAAWGDYDNDGDLDILLSGDTGAGFISRVYRNNGNGTFSDIAAGLTGVSDGAAAWGDYDNDGDLDILLSGSGDSGSITRVYRNNGNSTFADISAGLPGVTSSPAAWGDYENDGDLDILLTGDTGAGYISRVYRLAGVAANTAPAAPAGLSASSVAGKATLAWNAASDSQTTSSTGLSYNLRVGTTPGGQNVLAPMSRIDATSSITAPNGWRRIAARGPMQPISETLVLSTGKVYYWSVQAVDTALAGSPFAEERAFSVGAAPVYWLNATHVVSATNTITRDNSATSWSAGASSSRGLRAGYGYVQFQVGSTSDTLIAGLGSGDDDPTGNDIEFGLYFAAGKVQAIEKNALKGSAMTYVAGDVFKVAVEAGPVVKYYKNTTLIYTNSSPTLVYPLRLDTSLNSVGAAVKDGRISGGDLADLTARAAVPVGACQNVQWNPNPGYTTNVTAINGPPSAITKTLGANNTWNAGDSSLQSFGLASAPVSAMAVVGASTDYFVFGLSGTTAPLADSNTQPSDVDWGFYGYGANGTIRAVSQGAVVATLSGMAPGDLLRLDFSANQVRYFANDVPLLVVTYPGSNPYLPARVDTAFYNTGSRLNNVQICPSASAAQQGGKAGEATIGKDVPHITVGDARAQQREVTFGDVNSGDYFYEAVQYLGSRGVVSGYAGGTFRPYEPVTRAQLAKMLVMALGEPLRRPERPSFADVPAGSPFYSYVETAKWMGVVSGYAGGTFRPNAPVTRGQVAKMVVLAAALPLVSPAGAHFADVPADSPFYAYVETAQAYGLIAGYRDGSFRPDAGATRGQAAKIVFSAITADRWR